MELSLLFKKFICRVIILGLSSQIYATFALAVIPPPHFNPQIPDAKFATQSLQIHNHTFNKLVLEIVQESLSNELPGTLPTQAMLRCYKQINSGLETVSVEDALEALPELLCYAVQKYETSLNRSACPMLNESIHEETTKSPRPQSSYLPGAVVGTILADANCGNCSNKDFSEELCNIINLLLIIKKQIGTVDDDVCCNSVLGVLGDACNILGMSISEFLLTLSFNCTTSCQEICCDEIIETITECCAQTTSNFIVTWSLLEECCQATQSAIEDCCQLTESLLVEILDTLTQCCDDLADDIFDTQEIIIECCEQTQSNFEITWSLLENISFNCTATVDLSPVLNAVDNVQSTLNTCCEQTMTNFAFTWSLIDNLDFDCSVTVDLSPILDAVDGVQTTLNACCAQNLNNFEVTWSLMNNLEFECSLSVDLTPVLDAIDNVQTTLNICCAQTSSNFAFTWSLIDNLDLNVSVTTDLSPVLIAITEVENTLTACCAQTNSNFALTWSLLENISIGGCACSPIPITQANVLGGVATLSLPGQTYCLASNINGKIEITADDVTLLLNSFQIRNTVDDALFVGSVNNVTLKGGLVSAPNNNGINLATSINNVEITNVDFEGCSVGLNAAFVNSLVLDTCVFYNGQQGLVYSTVIGGALTNCQFVNNVAPTLLSVASFSNVHEITIENTYVTRNICSGSVPTDTIPVVYVLGSTNLKVVNIHVNENSNASSTIAGVKVEGCTNILFQNSEFNNNLSGLRDSYGLWVNNSALIDVEDCIANRNTADLGTGIAVGFYLESGDGCTIIGCTAKNQTGILTTAGIKVLTSQNCYIARNQVINNNNTFALGSGFGIWTDINSGGSSISVLQNYADQIAGSTTNYVGFVFPITTFTKAAPGFVPAPAIFDNVSAV